MTRMIRLTDGQLDRIQRALTIKYDSHSGQNFECRNAVWGEMRTGKGYYRPLKGEAILVKLISSDPWNGDCTFSAEWDALGRGDGTLPIWLEGKKPGNCRTPCSLLDSNI